MRTRDTQHSLTVKDIQESDIGEYTIEASNSKGHTKAQFRLKVCYPIKSSITDYFIYIFQQMRSPPKLKFDNTREHFLVRKGETCRLNVSLEGASGLMEVRWWKDGVLLRTNRNTRVHVCKNSLFPILFSFLKRLIYFFSTD